MCDDFWGKSDADVVCKQLGYNGSLSSTGDVVEDSRQNENVMFAHPTVCECWLFGTCLF